MPRVAEFAGIVIAMYAADHNPPHVHVSCADEEAIVEIATGTVLKGYVKAAKMRLATDWIEKNRATLQERWAALNP